MKIIITLVVLALAGMFLAPLALQFGSWIKSLWTDSVVEQEESED